MSSTVDALHGCIPSNPDIAGIGVRTSIYVQNFLGVIIIAVYLLDGEIDVDEHEHITTTSITILMTSCAIVVSAVIQAKTYGLSVYHALIVLNLSWMNNTNLTISVAVAIMELKKENKNGGKENESSEDAKKIAHKKKRAVQANKAAIIVGILHLSLVGGFGTWMWWNIDTFGNSPTCTPFISTVYLGHTILLSDKALHRMWRALYWITAIPVANFMAFFGAICVAFIFTSLVILFILAIVAGLFWLGKTRVPRFPVLDFRNWVCPTASLKRWANP